MNEKSAKININNKLKVEKQNIAARRCSYKITRNLCKLLINFGIKIIPKKGKLACKLFFIIYRNMKQCVVGLLLLCIPIGTIK